MATIEENYEFWNNRYKWSAYRGDQWSSLWGGPQAQWQWCIYPRVRQYLPAATVLEIGPGQGRWTQFLKDKCENLIVVDLSERCIDVCRERFGEHAMTYHVGDGKSLDGVADDSLDFVFSFESLIHTEIADLKCYLADLAKKLKLGGSAFIHHSNLGHYRTYYKASEFLPQGLKNLFRQRGFLDYDEWRAPSVTYENFEKAANEAGLRVSSQELIPWGGRRLIDCLSTLHRDDNEEDNRIYENRHFMRRAREIKEFSRLYGHQGSWLQPTERL